jgi:hypothetical protein
MKFRGKKTFLTAVLGCTLALGGPFLQAVQAEDVATRIGKLSYLNNYPTEETVQKLRDELLFQAAVQTYLWTRSLATVISMRDGQYQAGATNTSILISENFLTAEQVVPTGNQDTVYGYGVTVLGEEPMVFQIAPGILGFISDAWQRPIKDVGFVGPDQGKGGKYIIVPPDFKGEMPIAGDGEYVYQSPTKNIWWLQRGFAKDGDPAPAIKALKTSRIYKLSEASNPPEQHIINLSKMPYFGMPPRGFAYWEKIAEALLQETVQERDRAMMAMAARIGIEKGKPFAPDEHTKKILIDAEKVGEGMIKSLAFATDKPEAKIYPNRQWEYVFLTKSPYFESENYTEIYERAAFHYQAMCGAEAMLFKMAGKGSQYTVAFKDGKGNYLDGSNNYKLVVPANAPAKNYWSLSVYDVPTRSLVKNGHSKSSLGSNRPELKQNEDGTTDLYFGPDKPASGTTNWVKTNPGSDIFIYFRYWGPLEPYFDKTWVPNDVELID